MEYTAEQRMVLSAIFRLCQTHLRTPENPRGCRFICHAIQKLQATGLINADDKKIATEIVQSRLQGYYTLGGWLKTKSADMETAVMHDQHNGGNKIQATRMAWLKSLESEFGA